MSKAVLFFADGTEECEALLVADLLRRARSKSSLRLPWAAAPLSAATAST